MTELTIPDDNSGSSKTASDPACGSGRILLAIGRKHPDWELTGQDSDHRCAQMTAINLGLNGLHGWAVWQNSLTLKCHRVYKIGLNLSGGVIREMPVEKSPFDYRTAPPPSAPTVEPIDKPKPGNRQLDLF